MTAALIKFRDTLRKASPPWLQNGLAQRILYSIGVQLDAAADALNAGIKIRFPNVYSAESLPVIGRERRIRRGRLEDDATYAVRLRRWYEDHRRRGGPYAMLRQIWEHYQPDSFPIDLLYRSGMRFRMDVDGVVTRDELTKPLTPQWSKWTMIYFSADPGPFDETDIALVPREWIAAHCLGDVVVLPPGGELWDYPIGHTWDESGTWDTATPIIRVPIVGT